MLTDISMVCFPNTVSIDMPGTSLSTDISLLLGDLLLNIADLDSSFYFVNYK